MKPTRYILLALLFALSSSFAQDKQAEQTVYVTNTGKKYHVAGCSYLKSSKAISLADAIKSYSPCSRCRPPAEVKSQTPNGESKGKDAVEQKPDERRPWSGEKIIGTTPTGKTLYEGPRGGKYHYSKSGKKVYQRKKK